MSFISEKQLFSLLFCTQAAKTNYGCQNLCCDYKKSPIGKTAKNQWLKKELANIFSGMYKFLNCHSWLSIYMLTEDGVPHLIGCVNGSSL